MLAYIIRRLFYAIPILVGVNIITFALFFLVNTPDDMARLQLGVKHVTPQAIVKWKQERGYDKPLFYNPAAKGLAQLSDTIFVEKSLALFALQFGRTDQGRDIGYDIRTRMWPSLAIALPTLLIGLLCNISFALLAAFFRATYIDLWGVILAVVMMSISSLFYISRRPISGRKNSAPGADLGLRHRCRCDQIRYFTGRDRRSVGHRLGHALVPRHFSRRDRQGLCAHGARERGIRTARRWFAMPCATPCCR